MGSFKLLAVALGAALLVSACGGGGDPGSLSAVNSNPAPGALEQTPPPRITSISATDLKNSLMANGASGAGLLKLAGTPKCGVDIQYLKYGTTGGAGEATNASGVLMTPTGATGCTGSLPIVLYGHGTTTAKNYNLADLSDKTNPAYSEAILIAAMYAAQGFIVVAPNYAGYDSSKLSYGAYVNADQNSKEMMDILKAARTALPTLIDPVKDSGKLFITGYSQGGYVAMATHKAMQAANMTVTASAPMSGPYAMGAYIDAIFYGNVPLGSTLFAPLLINSYQKAYGNIYSKLSDIYTASYATGIDTLLPSNTPYTTLFEQGKLPATQLFSSTAPAPGFEPYTPPKTPAALAPLFALGFGQSNLINNATRLAFLQDAIAHPDGAVPSVTNGAPASGATNPLRIGVIKNDMRNWTPTRPVMLCGGGGDPTVFFNVNTKVMQGFWSTPSPAATSSLLTVLDVDSPVSGIDPIAFQQIKGGFAQTKAGTAAAAVAAGATDGGASAVVQTYHGGLVPPFCNAAAVGFFKQVLAAGI